MTKPSSTKAISATPPTYFTSVVAKMATEPVNMDLLMETLETKRTSMNKHTSMNKVFQVQSYLKTKKPSEENTNSSGVYTFEKENVEDAKAFLKEVQPTQLCFVSMKGYSSKDLHYALKQWEKHDLHTVLSLQTHPVKVQSLHVLRGPFVHKKSQERWEQTSHSCTLVLTCISTPGTSTSSLKDHIVQTLSVGLKNVSISVKVKTKSGSSVVKLPTSGEE
jgi:ribosomal protein S10